MKLILGKIFQCQPFKNQDYYKLRREHLRTGSVFTDDQFLVKNRNHEWRRPTEFCRNPQFFVSGVSRFDVNQGGLGDCWLIAAMANLTMHEKLFNFVVPGDNGDFDENYCGLFHFRFWHFGKFVDVVIDDKLPVSNGKLIFAKSTDDNEFWPALLEKAYAKLYGGYDQIDGGWSHEAFQDFSGGLIETYELNPSTPKLIFNFIEKSIEKNVFFACAIMSHSKNLNGTGLIKGHAYSISSAMTLKVNPHHSVNLLRIRNPWGQGEWKGAWSDRSNEWRSIQQSLKAAIGLVIEEDGEFWISFEDFRKYFEILDVCNVHPDIEMREPNPTRKWNLLSHEGDFASDLQARGFYVTFEDPDLTDNEDFCVVIISLMQKHARKNKKNKNVPISFKVHSVDKKILVKEAIKSKNGFRGVCRRFELPPGRYFIEPFQLDNPSGDEFLLRVYYETKIDSQINQNMYPTLEAAKGSTFVDMTQYYSRDTGGNLRSQLSQQQPRRAQKHRHNTCCTIM